MPLDRIEWINSLCSRLYVLLQDRFQKEYVYNFNFASQATQNSIKMMESQKTEHFEPITTPATAEVIATVEIGNNDESALVNLVNIWNKSDKHKKLLENNGSLGIGFAYDGARFRLYATVRLGE